MINLIGIREFVDYDVKPCINVAIEYELSASLQDVIYLEDLAPHPALWQMWKRSTHSAQDWGMFKALYILQLASSKCQCAIQTLADLDEIYHRVNVIANEPLPDFSHRSLLVDFLDDLEVQVLLK